MKVKQLIYLLQQSESNAEVIVEDIQFQGVPSPAYGRVTRLCTIDKKRSGWVAKLGNDIVSPVYKSLFKCQADMKQRAKSDSEFKKVTFQEVVVLSITNND